MTAEWHAIEVLDELERRRRRDFDRARSLIVRSLKGPDGPISSHPDDGMHDPRMAPILLTIDDVADALQVSATTVKRLIREGRLRAVKIERATRIRRTDLEAYTDELVSA